MGVFDEKADDVIVIRDEKNWEPHETATVRTVVKVSDFEWVQNQLVSIKQSASKQRRRGAFAREKGMDIQTQTGASDRLWVFRMLKSWTFTRAGQPVQLTLQAVRELPQDVLNFIYGEIQKRQPKDAEEEEAETDEEEEGDEEGTPFSGDASISTDDSINETDQDEKPMKSNRNFLSKS